MQSIKTIWHKADPRLTHPVNSYKTWHFKKTDLLYRFADKHGIKVYSEAGLKTPEMKSLMRSMEIHTVGHADDLASSLNRLLIREIMVGKGVDLDRNIIERSRLMYYLEKYIDEEQTLYKMVVQRIGFRKCFINDARCLIVAQEIGRDPGEQGDERRDLAKFVLSRISPPENKTIISVVSPEDAKNYTAHPGDKFAVVAEMAEILAVIPEPGTQKPLLDPEVLRRMEMGEKMKLDGHIMKAVIKFKEAYMGIPGANGDLGPIEMTRLLTYNLGYMLTKMINPETGNPFLFPEVLEAMEPQQQIMLGFGRYNPIYEGAKAFLKLNWPEKAETVAPNDILHDHRVYDMVQANFRRQTGII